MVQTKENGDLYKEMLDISEKLLEAEARKLDGCKQYTPEQVGARLMELINE